MTTWFAEFHAPARLIPNEVASLPDQGILLFPSTQKCTLIQQVEHEQSLGIIISGSRESLTSDEIKHRLSMTINFLTFLFPDTEIVRWSSQAWLTIQRSPQNLRRTDDLFSTARARMRADLRPHYQGLQIISNFLAFELSGVLGKGCVLNLLQLLSCYLQLGPHHPLRVQIELFNFACYSQPLFSLLYDNRNLKFSLLFTVLEARLPRPSSKTPVRDRIDMYLSDLRGPDDAKAEFAEFLKEVYKRARNPFYHENANFKDHMAAISQVIQRLGRSSFNLKDVLTHGDVRTADFEFENFLRIELLNDLLEHCVHSTDQET